MGNDSLISQKESYGSTPATPNSNERFTQKSEQSLLNRQESFTSRF